jgi:3-oxoacyl-[acyl-carrier protein] reductase
MTSTAFAERCRVAIVTGGASGIGHASARALAARGDAVAIVDQNMQRAMAVVAELRQDGHSASAHKLDVRDRAACILVIEEIAQRWGQIDVLVHSAGVGLERPFLETTAEEWERTLTINLSGTFHICQAVAKNMAAARQGRIVLMSSAAGVLGGTGRAAYGASKGGMISLGQVMAVELAPLGITVNSLAPGPIETDLVARTHDEETRRAYTSGIPMARYGTPEEVAAAVVFLASPEASYISGHTLSVDGGFATAGVMKRPT